MGAGGERAASLETALECERFRQEKGLLVAENGQLRKEYDQLVADRQEQQLEVERLQQMVEEKGGSIRELAERCESLQRQVSEGAAMAELESYCLVARERDKWEARETRLEQQLDKLRRRLDRRRSSRSSSEHRSCQSYSSSSESEREDSGSRYVGSCAEPSLGQDKVVSSVSSIASGTTSTTSMACLMSDPRGGACSNQPVCEQLYW